MRTLSRRSLLTAGTVATAGAGALVVGERERGRRWLHSAGILHSPDHPAPHATVAVDEEMLASRHMGGPVAWAAAVPDATPEALVLCLHGRNGTHRTAFDAIGVHRFVAAGALPWVVVGVDGGRDSYWHRRVDGTDARAMVFEELLPELDARHGRLPLALLGWSMGGFGALAAAAAHPDRVAAAAAASPALWSAFGQTAPGAFDSAADFAANDVFRSTDVLRRLPVRIDCGDEDPFASAAHRLAAALPGAEAAFGTGFHDSAFWRSRVPAQLAFLAKTL
ncbi:MAG TPA: alpha/beta fold hydrolase [Acidimicrobiales bacterium]|nr:alpha/beta fold hydrolase [Acidimicrobiales bacterium]